MSFPLASRRSPSHRSPQLEQLDEHFPLQNVDRDPPPARDHAPVVTGFVDTQVGGVRGAEVQLVDVALDQLFEGIRLFDRQTGPRASVWLVLLDRFHVAPPGEAEPCEL